MTVTEKIKEKNGKTCEKNVVLLETEGFLNNITWEKKHENFKTIIIVVLLTLWETYYCLSDFAMGSE